MSRPNTSGPKPAESASALMPPPPPPHVLEADTDANVAIGSEEEFVDSTKSLTSSIQQYRTLHGRTYHSERDGVEYWYVCCAIRGIGRGIGLSDWVSIARLTCGQGLQ
jgi:hypothetical protein